MTKYNAALNLDVNDKLTSAYYDQNVAAWIQKSQMHVLSSGGILVPVSLDANSRFQASVKDSALPAGASTSAKQDSIITFIDQLESCVDGIEAALGDVAADPAANTILARLKTLATLIGEVKADPTANTLLARIKSIEDKLTAGIPLSGSIVEETRNQSSIVVSKKRKLKYYPELLNDFTVYTGTARPFKDGSIPIDPIWMSKEGSGIEIIGRSMAVASHIMYSSDGGNTWVKVSEGMFHDAPRIFTTPSPNKSIIAIKEIEGKTNIYRSTTLGSYDPSNWEIVLSDIGPVSARYGFSRRGNVICISNYDGAYSGGIARFIYISRDSGATWKTIEVVKVEDMPDPSSFHIHDVEYDPFTHRIWVSNGDGTNTNLRYSDDWGETWTGIANTDNGLFSAGQPTNIIALPDRVLFGSDSKPNGFYAWYKNLGEAKAPVTAEDIYHIYTPDSIALSTESHCSVPIVSLAPTDDQISVYPYMFATVFARSTTQGIPDRVIATPDGENFFEIWRSDMIASIGWDTVLGAGLIGPVPGHDYMYLSLYHATIGNALIKIPAPQWIEVKE